MREDASGSRTGDRAVRRASAPPPAEEPTPAPRPTEGLSTSLDLDRAFATHAETVARSLRRLVADPETVDDLVQETFLRAWRQRHSFAAERSPLRSWLLLVARGAAVDHLRTQRVRPWHRRSAALREDEADVVGDDPTEQVLTGWLVEEEVRRLPLPLRQVVVETQLRDRPHADVAADLGIPVGTVRSRLFHALRTMRTSLEAQGYVP